MFKTLKSDLSSSIVVFFVALPLCLGIALASNAPLMAGLISGIVGGILVGILSGSQLGVSGPAAGLTVIVSSSILVLGSWDNFLSAVILAGIIQFAFGYFSLGFLAYFFPLSVIYGMLSGIGILIILKQIPHAIGYDKSFFGEEEFSQLNHENTISSLIHSFSDFDYFSILIFIFSICLLIIWEKKLSNKFDIFKIIQGPIVVVFLGAAFVFLNQLGFFSLNISSEHLVTISDENLLSNFHFLTIPNIDNFLNLETYKIALLIAVVASLETLLCLEATDKLDPQRRVSPPNKELKAQGIGNLICGFVGALPVTQVIVRSSANINFGAKTKLSAIFHGFWLLIAVVFLIPIMSLIPLASLSAILIIVGYKLAKPALFKEMYSSGKEQFIPFIITIIGIISINLLNGIILGLITGLLFSLYRSYQNSYELKDVITNKNGVESHYISLAEEISFFNKANLMRKLESIPNGSQVTVDFARNKYMALDIEVTLKDFKTNAEYKNLKVKFINNN
jgi:MFS superfamily sulfate permease-like transporter